jgi:uncharacterized protein (UPF0332 family)
VALVERRLAQAAETLQVAGEVLAAGHCRDAVNRAYYAMFYAGLALLATRMLGTNKHSGVLSLLGEHFVKTGQISVEAGRRLHQAFELRQKSDYREDFEPTREQTGEVLANARSFVEDVRRVWQDLRRSD